MNQTGLLTRHIAIDVPVAYAANCEKNLRDCNQKPQVFTRAKGKRKAQSKISTISAESILILVELNWIQMETVIWLIWLVWFIWLV